MSPISFRIYALQKLSVTDSSLVMGSTTIQPSSVVRNLGVLFDSELTFKQHVSKIASSSVPSVTKTQATEAPC